MEPESSRFEKGNKPTKHQFFEGSMLVCDPEKNKHLERIHQQSTSNASNLRKWRVVTFPNGGEQMGNDHARIHYIKITNET